ncbi:MAG: XRE family transcriptional regulator [Ruminiclostridium sp.]|nr:XRE family transcriptional regulator [Ruminiclostridium sp.]
MDIVDRIRQLANQKKVSLTKIEKALGFGNGTIGKWTKQSPSCEKIKLVADYLSTSTDYLIYGGGSTLQEDALQLLDYFRLLDDNYKNRVLERAETLKELLQVESDFKKAELEAAAKEKIKPKPKAIPLPTSEPEPSEDIDNEDEEGYIYLDFPDLPVSAGTGVYLHDDYAEQIRVPINDETLRANYALRVAGDSMEPQFYDGDIVLVETQPSVKVGEIGIFIYEGEAYIKEFGGDRLISLNSKYDDKQITDFNSFYCKGLVIGVLDKKHILN